jgi:hypothetical protein
MFSLAHYCKPILEETKYGAGPSSAPPMLHALATPSKLARYSY